MIHRDENGNAEPAIAFIATGIATLAVIAYLAIIV